MPNLLQALGAGGAGVAEGASLGPVGMASMGALNFLGSLFGGQHEDPQMKAMRRQQQDISNRLYQFGTSVPGSSPDELAQMAEARGQLGAQQRGVQQRVFGAYNPQQGLPAAQMLSNLQNTFTAQQMAQHASFLQDSGAARRQALMNAASVGQGAAGLYRPQQSQFPQVAGQLAQMLAYQQARNKGQAGAGAAAGAGTGAGAVDMNAGWNPAGTSGTTAQYPGNTQPGPPVDWNALAASGQLGSPQGEDMSMYGAPSWAGAFGTPQPSAAVQGINADTGRNAPQGTNGTNNANRQSIIGSTTAQVNNLLRRVVLPGGVQLHF